MPTTQRSYAGGRFMLDISGHNVGFLKSVEGGAIYSEVITEASGVSQFANKHISNPRYESVEVAFGMSMGSPLYDWIQAVMTGQSVRKNGAVLECDAKYQVLEVTEFFDAVISGITIPKMDGTSKESAYMTVKIVPELIRSKAGDGKKMTVPGKKGKNWLTSNFRLEIDGLDGKGVVSVDSFSWKQTPAGAEIGERRDYLKEPGKIEIPNLRVTLAANHAQTWLEWFDSFVVKGNNTTSNEKSGALIYLAPDLKTELARVKLFNMGIFRLAREKVEPSSEKARRLVADLYCERMEWEMSK